MMMPLSRTQVLHILQSHEAVLARYGVARLALDSDVDVLVEFNRPIGLFEFLQLQAHLETLLGCHVDLVTPDALRDESRDTILGEAVDVPRLANSLSVNDDRMGVIGAC
jgi:predicted nucleotidyltransferase